MVILITGCSQGLGLAMCRYLFKKKNVRLVITARSNIEGLRAEFGHSQRVLIRKLDLQDLSHLDELIEDVKNKFGGIDVLINNAAIVHRGVLEHISDQEEKTQMQTNYFAPRTLIKAVLPIMKSKDSCKIINISSVAGMMSMPTMSSYSASKHALEGMSEALWYELKPLGVSVTVVQIGFVNSDSFKHSIQASGANNERTEDIYRYYYSTMDHFITSLMKLALDSPDDLAKKIYEKVIAKENPPFKVAITLDTYIFSAFRRLLPSRLYHGLLYRLLPTYWKFKIRALLRYLDSKV